MVLKQQWSVYFLLYVHNKLLKDQNIEIDR
jgi:hypothetical protein